MPAVFLEMSGPSYYLEVGPDNNVSREPLSHQSEMTVDVNPTNPLHVAGFSHNVGNVNEIDVFYSINGGSTWSTNTIDHLDDGLSAGATRFDPSIAFDANGNLFVAYGHNDGSRVRLVVARGTVDAGSGALNFDRFRVVSTQANIATLRGTLPGNDKFHLATGRRPGIGGQAVYLAWTQNVTEGFSPDQRIVVSGSRNDGDTWTAPLIINNASITGTDTSNLFADPAVGPNGELYVAWHDINAGTIFVDNDLDGLWLTGDNFGTDVVVQTGESLFKFIVPAAPQRGIHTGPVLDVDRSGGPFHGRLYLTYVHQTAGNNTDIWLEYSDDRGVTWTRTTVENSAGTDFLPWVDVDQLSGAVHVIYYTTDGDVATGNDDVRVRLASSSNGGVTFTKAFLSSTTSNETLGYGGDYLEYIGLAAHGGTIHGLWADNSGSGTDLEAFTASAIFYGQTGNTLRIEGTSGNDTFLVRRSAVNNAYLEVIVNGVRQYAGLAGSVHRLRVSGGSNGGDTLTVDFSNGNPIPALWGVTFDGGLGDDVMRLVNTEFPYFSAWFNGGSGTDTVEVVLSPTSARDLTLIDWLVHGDGFLSGNVFLDSVEQADLTGGSGDNRFDASAFTRGRVIFTGGDGHDELIGGSAGDVLVGNGGNDTLRGGDGRDLLIGGDGVDVLLGGEREDLLIGGFTTHDTNSVALRKIHAEWSSARSRTDRMTNLRGTSNIGPRLNGIYVLTTGPFGTVQDDGDADTLRGEDEVDWFFARVLPSLPADLIDAWGEPVDRV